MFHKRVTGTGNIAVTVDPGKAFALLEVRLHLGAAGGANSFTVSVDSAEGSAYDTLLKTQDMSSATDVAFIPTRPHVFTNGDKIACAWTNASSILWGLEVIWE